MSFRTCNHLKEDGVPCGSPALRRKKFCYYHLRDHRRSQYSAGLLRRADILGPRLPRMNSLEDIQLALGEVLNAIASHSVSLNRAGRILFDLQQATTSLCQPDRAPE